jgi:alkanesulfonate monooxygenase SsuD/methylene tetrahydromethanopterin reductase-like flavin-dependent oxidoreductase (luciferase family)
LAGAIDRVRRRAAEYGRDPNDVGIAYSAEMWYDDRRAHFTPDGRRRAFTGAPEQIAGDIRAYEGVGVQYLMLNFQGDTLEESEERMERFADEIRPLAER